MERLVLSVLTAMGYGGAAGAADHLGKAGDEGLGWVTRQDPLGLDRIYVQATGRKVTGPFMEASLQLTATMTATAAASS